MESISLLLKVGKKEHLESLRKGNVYCNALQFFKESEIEGNGMKDRFECGQLVSQFTELSVKFEDHYVPVLKNGFAVFDEGRFNGNVFCGYFINIAENDIKGVDKYPLNISSPITDSVDSFVLINDIKEFTKRMERAVNVKGNKLYYGPVEYLNLSKHDGEITPFNKDKKYKNQCEWRYYINRNANSKDDAVCYELGDLSDIISEVIEIEFLPKLTIFRDNKIPTA